MAGKRISQERKLEFVGKAKPCKLDEVGYVEEDGLKAIERGKGNVEVFFPSHRAGRTEYFSRRVFLADFVEKMDEEVPYEGSCKMAPMSV